ncbi:hypothetical protein AB0I37_28995 [Micromonospora purpureochromogenes]|uniref:hypothetical protein n=1 Tax=Micromonospora purpureochromogenes TaxID=47872 RepID=UPI0033D25730
MTDEALAGLARNPARPAGPRDLLVHHPAVVEAAAANPALPASVMRRLLTPPGNALPG